MSLPDLSEFRLEFQDNGLVYLVFDCPGRTMNVFSNKAIHELGAFATWLADADVKGVVIRSGKSNAFCAGADLSELGVAYDMIMAAPQRARFNVAFDHFFPLSRAIRALETAEKPVAAAIAGLALGGGCELALGAHYRVLVDDPKIGMGLPESLVGLLPGAGGTQRLPRLIGVEAALPILLDGARLSGQAAVDAGLVHALAKPGEEIAVAEAWLLSGVVPQQPWDTVIASEARQSSSDGGGSGLPRRFAPRNDDLFEARRSTVDPHNPALAAILDCIEFGLPQCFDGAIRSEMSIFAQLIQRPEPRNMIQTLFLGKTDYDRMIRKDASPPFIADVIAAVNAVPGDRDDPAVLSRISAAVAPWQSAHSAEALRIADYAVVKETGYPGFLGGPFTFAVRGFS